jgi:hypothetical protein
MLEEAHGTEMSMLYGVTALGARLQAWAASCHFLAFHRRLLSRHPHAPGSAVGTRCDRRVR